MRVTPMYNAVYLDFILVSLICVKEWKPSLLLALPAIHNVLATGRIDETYIR